MGDMGASWPESEDHVARWFPMNALDAGDLVLSLDVEKGARQGAESDACTGPARQSSGRWHSWSTGVPAALPGRFLESRHPAGTNAAASARQSGPALRRPPPFRSRTAPEIAIGKRAARCDLAGGGFQ